MSYPKNNSSPAGKKKELKNKTSVLLAVADDKYGMAIADFAAKHNWPDDTEFCILYVVEEQLIKRWITFSPDLVCEIIHEDEVYGSDLARRVEERIRQSIPSAKIEKHVAHGMAKNEILHKAKEINANLILVGTHGRTGVTSILLGSVSMAVITHADCSVMVVRVPPNANADTLGVKLSETDLPPQMVAYK